MGDCPEGGESGNIQSLESWFCFVLLGKISSPRAHSPEKSTISMQWMCAVKAGFGHSGEEGNPAAFSDAAAYIVIFLVNCAESRVNISPLASETDLDSSLTGDLSHASHAHKV